MKENLHATPADERNRPKSYIIGQQVTFLAPTGHRQRGTIIEVPAPGWKLQAYTVQLPDGRAQLVAVDALERIG
jgi:hypothetical protein